MGKMGYSSSWEAGKLESSRPPPGPGLGFSRCFSPGIEINQAVTLNANLISKDAIGRKGSLV